MKLRAWKSSKRKAVKQASETVCIAVPQDVGLRKRMVAHKRRDLVAGGQGNPMTSLSLSFDEAPTAASRAAAAAAKIPEPQPMASREKRKKVSWHDDASLVLVRYFLQVQLSTHSAYRCASSFVSECRPNCLRGNRWKDKWQIGS